ncbi:site-2 protease. Metallo peptidase. MEROPS family M50B [Desulfocicer vacuolatum DSM 3385]|uniref:Zinc metalloprotease n=1 Tax=Desulfocicer vacuolatum DSM 3385 TaxID=1121400 RepID=A0A1W2BU89_9BACT|nr:RIP metalloprotease RseP [Desulfocicer vacuolatum]SMC76286.1 site-2 protease. Metallo peptidase. MEROPS family M50B [Desulfocicer vacuolatum DSM 3385]
MGNSLVAFVIVLGILVFFHELGHFLMARFFGVGVETFSLGFGPKIYRRRVGFTQYCISLIPLGGYVKMVGEEPGAPLAETDLHLSFNHKKLYQKILIVAAGPLFNFLLAFLIFYAIFQFSGLYFVKPVVGEIGENSPAQVAGMVTGDVVVAIDGKPVTSWDDMVALIGDSAGEILAIQVERSGRDLLLQVVPETRVSKNIFGEDINRHMIGVGASGDVTHISLNPFQALWHGALRTWEISRLTVLSVVKIFKGSVSADSLGGPIMIAQMAGKQAKAGVASFFFFIAMLSVNLGIINLFPVPVLDGGHILFFCYEAVTGKPAGEKFREQANRLGMGLLLALMVFVFYNDIIRIFNGG